jgi:CxxC motif-containing protein (DUF1111 family)
MGSLGDGIVQNHAAGDEMRTLPLWGIRCRSTFRHDGRATSRSEAIQAHDGQGKAAADAFRHLSGADTNALRAFLNSL